MTKEVGGRLKSLRKKHKIRQRQLADFLGISQSLYAKIEMGERNLKLTLMQRLCDVYCCPIEHILYGEPYEEDMMFKGGKDIPLEVTMKMNKICRNLKEMDRLIKENEV